MAKHAADFSEINPHLALWQSENYVSHGEVRWYAWVRACEVNLGHGLDGNEATEGFSLDYANDAFEAGVTVAEYVSEVMANKAALDCAFGPLLSPPPIKSRRGYGSRGTAF